MNDLDLPSRRPLPPATRERLHRRVAAGLEIPPRARFDRVRSPLAAAAAVGVLIAGAAIVTQSVGSDPDGSDPATPPTTTPLGVADRCHRATVLTSMVRLYPDRREWEVVTQASGDNITVTGFRAGDVPIFCVTTPTKVTVSDPTILPYYAGDSRTGALLTLPDGGIGGVVDPTWTKVGVFAENADGAYSITMAEPSGGLFVATQPYSPGRTEVWDETGDIVEARSLGDGLPLPAANGVTVEDRPAGMRTPPPTPLDDETAREFLRMCLERTDPPTRDGWRPGAYTVVVDSVVLARHDDGRTGACRYSPERDRYDFDLFDTPSASTTPWRHGLYSIGTKPTAEVVLVGTVPPSARSMRLTLGGTAQMDATVVNGTFVLVFPAGSSTGQPDNELLSAWEVERAVVRDAEGQVVYDGELPR